MIREEEQLGILPIEEALRIAMEADLDLVEVAPTADPPVCRIMDYGRFRYEQSKRERESRRSSKHVELREVRMKVKIGQHDIDFKARTASKLLDEGDKVKVSVMFRAREITHPEIGEQLLERFFERVSDHAVIERRPTMEGRFMAMTLEPSRKRPVEALADESPAEASAEAPAKAAVAAPAKAAVAAPAEAEVAAPAKAEVAAPAKAEVAAPAEAEVAAPAKAKAAAKAPARARAKVAAAAEAHAETDASAPAEASGETEVAKPE